MNPLQRGSPKRRRRSSSRSSDSDAPLLGSFGKRVSKAVEMPGQQQKDGGHVMGSADLANGGGHSSSSVDSFRGGDVTSKPPSSHHEEADRVADLARLNEQLSSDIRCLRAENEAFSESVKGLERQVRESAAKVDSLVSSNKQAEDKRSQLEAQASAARDEASSLQQEKRALEEERSSLQAKKQKLEAGLANAGRKISDLSKKVDDAESAAASAKERVDRLDAEFCRLASENRCLSTTNDSLKALSAQTLSELNTLRTCKEQERERMMEQLRKAVEEASSLRSSLNMMRAAEESYKSKIAMLESEFLSASQRIIELEVQDRERVSVGKQLEARVSELEKELGNAARELQKEQEVTTTLQEQLVLLESRKLVLEDEVKSALVTMQKMQDITQKEQGQRMVLEDQVALAMKEKGLIEEARNALDVELKTMTATASKAAVASQAEILCLKQKAQGLEMALGRVKEEALSSEKKVWQLLSEIRVVKEALESKSAALKYALPAAILSTGAFVLAGVCGYFRYKQARAGYS